MIEWMAGVAPLRKASTVKKNEWLVAMDEWKQTTGSGVLKNIIVFTKTQCFK